MEYCEDNEKVIEDEQDSEGGWVDTHHFDNSGALNIEEKVSFLLHFKHLNLILYLY